MDLSDLSLEENFKVRSFNLDADRLSHEQASQLAKDMYLTMLRKEATYKVLLKQSLGSEFPKRPAPSNLE